MQPQVAALVQALGERQVGREKVQVLAEAMLTAFSEIRAQVPNPEAVEKKVESLKPRAQMVLTFLVKRYIRDKMQNFSIDRFETFSESEKDALRMVALQDAMTSYTWGEALFDHLNLAENFEAWRFVLPLFIPHLVTLICDHFGEAKPFGGIKPEAAPKAAAMIDWRLEKVIEGYNRGLISEIKNSIGEGKVPKGISDALTKMGKIAGRSLAGDSDWMETASKVGGFGFWAGALLEGGWGAFLGSAQFWFEGLFASILAGMLSFVAGFFLVALIKGGFRLVNSTNIRAAKRVLEDLALKIHQHLQAADNQLLNRNNVVAFPVTAEMVKIAGKWRLVMGECGGALAKVKSEIESEIATLAQGGFSKAQELDQFASALNIAKIDRSKVQILLSFEGNAFLGFRIGEGIYLKSIGEKNMMRLLVEKVSK